MHNSSRQKENVYVVKLLSKVSEQFYALCSEQLQTRYVKSLVAQLKDGARVRYDAVDALKKLPSIMLTEKENANAIVKLLEDRRWTVRKAAVDALASLYPPEFLAKHIGVLIARLGDVDADVRKATLRELNN